MLKIDLVSLAVIVILPIVVLYINTKLLKIPFYYFFDKNKNKIYRSRLDGLLTFYFKKKIIETLQ